MSAVFSYEGMMLTVIAKLGYSGFLGDLRLCCRVLRSGRRTEIAWYKLEDRAQLLVNVVALCQSFALFQRNPCA